MMERKEKRVRGTDQPWQAFAAGQLQGLSPNLERPFGVESMTVGDYTLFQPLGAEQDFP